MWVDDDWTNAPYTEFDGLADRTGGIGRTDFDTNSGWLADDCMTSEQAFEWFDMFDYDADGVLVGEEWFNGVGCQPCASGFLDTAPYDPPTYYWGYPSEVITRPAIEEGEEDVPFGDIVIGEAGVGR